MCLIDRDHADKKQEEYSARLKRAIFRHRTGYADASGLIGNIEEFGDLVREHARRAGHHLTDQAHMVHRKAKENPAATFVIAAGIGFLAAMLIRRF